MKTTVEITDSLFEQVKLLAVQEGTSFRLLVEQGLQAVVAARTTSELQPFRLRDGSFAGGEGLQPGIRWTDLNDLAYDEGGTVQS